VFAQTIRGKASDVIFLITEQGAGCVGEQDRVKVFSLEAFAQVVLDLFTGFLAE
jgi:hypothetical protein